MVTLLIERAVNESTPLPPQSTARDELEPLQAVLRRDLQMPPVKGPEDELANLSPAERARRLLDVDDEGRR
jgi:hypothetical protein